METEDMKEAVKRETGFRIMDPEVHREISSKGGKAVHKMKKGHEWTSEEAQAAGRSARARMRQRKESE